MSSVLVFSPYSIGNPHLECLLEQVLLSAERGDEVTLVTCRGELKNCGTIACNSSLICGACQDRATKARALLEKNNIRVKFAYMDFRKVDISQDFVPVESALELKTLKWRGKSVGMAVASTLISKYRDRDLQLDSALKREAQESFEKAAQLYDWACRFLDQNHFDVIYMFNGRLTLTRPLGWAAAERAISYYCLEQGATLWKYIAVKNALPHDKDARKAEMNKLWAEGAQAPQARDEKAAQWFQQRRDKAMQNYVVFIEGQKRGLLPEAFRPASAARKISIFVSSEDEFAAIENFENTFFKDQNEGIAWVLKCTQVDREAGKVELCVRVHPNLAGLKNKQIDYLMGLAKLPGVTVLGANDPADTYGIAEASDLVIVFGTTVGIESVYAGKNVLLLGPCLWEENLGVIRPQNLMDAEQVVRGSHAFDKSAEQKKDALRYGYWQATMGIPYKYFRADSISTGQLLGERLWPTPLRNLAFLLGRFVFLLKCLAIGKLSIGGLASQYKKYRKLRRKVAQLPAS